MSDERIERLEKRLQTAQRKAGAVLAENRKATEARKAIVDRANRESRSDLNDAEDQRFRELTKTITDLDAQHRTLSIEAEEIQERIMELSDEEKRAELVTAGAAAVRRVWARVADGERDRESWLPSRRRYAEMATEQRATGYANAGAVLLTGQHSTWFDRLRSKSVVLTAGPQQVPVPGHALSIPILNTSATVSNYDENSQITPSDPDLDPVVLTPVKFAALVNVANEALTDSSPELRKIIEEDLLRTTATAIDTAFLVGPGGTGPVKVLGLRNKAGVTDTGNTLLGANGAVPSLDTFADMIGTLEGVGGDPATAAFFVTPGVWGVIRKIKKNGEAGNYAVQPDVTQVEQRSLFGVKVFVTANLPQNETKGAASGVCSSIVLADMSRVVVGVGQDVRVQMSEDARFDYDQTAIRVVGRFDLQVLNEAAVVVTKGAKLS